LYLSYSCKNHRKYTKQRILICVSFFPSSNSTRRTLRTGQKPMCVDRHPAMTRHKWNPCPRPYAKLLAIWRGSKRNTELRIRGVWDMILIQSDWSTLANEGTMIIQNVRNKSSNKQPQNPEKSSLQQPYREKLEYCRFRVGLLLLIHGFVFRFLWLRRQKGKFMLTWRSFECVICAYHGSPLGHAIIPLEKIAIMRAIIMSL